MLLGGCEALEPEWSGRVWAGPADPVPQAACSDVCELQGKACMARQCDGSTIAVYSGPLDEDPDELIAAACEETFEALAGGELGWQLNVECCCTTGES